MVNTDNPLKANQAKKRWLPMQIYFISSSNIAGGHNPGFFHEHSVAKTKQTATHSGGPGIGYRFYKVGAPAANYTTGNHPLTFYSS